MSNQLREKNIANSDNNIEEIKEKLQIMFPDMSKGVVNKHIAFVELLDEYENSTIHGIEEFLDEKKYEYKGIKYLNGDSISIPVEYKNKIEKGTYLVGFKSFYESKKSGETQIDAYMIIAKKKSNPMMDQLREGISNFVNKSVGSNV